jgi:Ca2+-binding EF-hand superfamily protein
MRNKFSIGRQLALLGLTSLCGAAALASSNTTMPNAPADDQEVVTRFNAADKNGDGKVTLEEAQAGLPRVALAWEKIDVNKKGYITLEQLLFIAAANK